MPGSSFTSLTYHSLFVKLRYYEHKKRWLKHTSNCDYPLLKPKGNENKSPSQKRKWKVWEEKLAQGKRHPTYVGTSLVFEARASHFRASVPAKRFFLMATFSWPACILAGIQRAVPYSFSPRQVHLCCACHLIQAFSLPLETPSHWRELLWETLRKCNLRVLKSMGLKRKITALVLCHLS